MARAERDARAQRAVHPHRGDRAGARGPRPALALAGGMRYGLRGGRCCRHGRRGRTGEMDHPVGVEGSRRTQVVMRTSPEDDAPRRVPAMTSPARGAVQPPFASLRGRAVEDERRLVTAGRDLAGGLERGAVDDLRRSWRVPDAADPVPPDGNSPRRRRAPRLRDAGRCALTSDVRAVSGDDRFHRLPPDEGL